LIAGPSAGRRNLLQQLCRYKYKKVFDVAAVDAIDSSRDSEVLARRKRALPGGLMSYNVIEVDKESRTWGMLAHLSSFAGYVIPFGNIFGPLIIWLMKRDLMEFVNDQGKEALNFQISMTIYIVISIPLCFILIGIPILIGLALFDVIIKIIAAVKANEGVRYRYPLCIRFIK
jgi:uncharacterized Tic20 family protein